MARPTATGKGRGLDRIRQCGVTYLIVLFLVALVGMGLAALGTVWHTEVQRDRERELLFIGEQFGVALRSYYEASKGGNEYPHRLEDLLEDRRDQVLRRHLRQIFVDPLTGRRDWVLIMVSGQITAVRSRSQGVPFVRTGFPPDWEAFADAQTHAEWVFRPRPPRAGTMAPAMAQSNAATPQTTDASVATPSVAPASADAAAAPRRIPSSSKASRAGQPVAPVLPGNPNADLGATVEAQ